MRTIVTLGYAYLRHQPARLLLTALAILVAACMVVWVVSGYDALIRQFAEFSHESFGRYTLTVIPARPEVGPTGIPLPGDERYVSPDVVEALRRDPDVLEVEPMWAQRALVMRYSPQTFRRAMPTSTTTAPANASQTSTVTPGTPGRRGGVALVGTNALEPPFPILRGRWIDPVNSPMAMEAVLSADAAQRLGVDLGDAVSTGVGERAQKLTIIGITDAPVIPDGGTGRPPAVLGPAAGGLYVPMKLAEFILDRPVKYSFVSLALRPEADVTRFRFSWSPRLNQANPPLQFQDAQELEQALNESATAENLRTQAYSATGLALLAALFIIFTTLNMGVSERARQFAILRAVVLTRRQVAGLIGLEAIALAVLGWIGGLLAGYGLLWVAAHLNPALGSEGGAVIGRWSLSLSAACAFGGAACAAVVPAIRAMRQRPIDAMAPRQEHRPHLRLGMMTVCGLVLIAVHPMLTYVIPAGDAARYAVYAAIGCTCMAIGFILITPLFVLITEHLFAPMLAGVFGLERQLLAGQLSGNLWRTVGSAVAMSVGLGLFVAMQVWGYTMLRPFEPGTWVPEALIAFLPDGLPRDRIDDVRQLPGLDRDAVFPLAVEQPKLAEDITGSAERATVTRQDNIVLVGLDPDRGIGGADPLLQMEWIDGSPRQAVEMMKAERGCIVPDHFCRETGLKLGDRFDVNPPADNSRRITYRIAGVVRLPGSHWMTKLSGMRLRSARTAALCFADYDTVAADFEVDTDRFYWARARAGSVDPEAMAEAARQLAERVDGREYSVVSEGLPQFDRGPRIRVTTPEDVTRRIRGRADGWIWSLSKLPLVTLAISAIGLLNAMLASVRVRLWDMGVLRAIGFTRSAIVRVVLAESLLIGVVATLLSLSFGILAGWCGAGISQYVSFFGGLHPDLTIPWAKLGLGIGTALGLCILASAWPALSIGRVKPLQLLQAGRGAF